MKLQQLRFVAAIAKHGLNISETAKHLYTSQPGVSKQLQMLETELGTPLFTRTGKNLTGLTEAGRLIIQVADEILAKVNDIRQIAEETRNNVSGKLAIGTTHNQARYALPPVIKAFMSRYPGITLTLHQGTPAQMAEMASKGLVDLVVTTEVKDRFRNLILLPCHTWSRTILVLPDHPLVRQQSRVTLADVAAYPIVTYVHGFSGRSQMDQAFENHGLEPDIVLAATDADVIKTYVRLGLGLGIVARMAHDPENDQDLVALDASHLFEPSVTKVGFRWDMFITGYVADFIQMLSPQLTREAIDQATSRRRGDAPADQVPADSEEE